MIPKENSWSIVINGHWNRMIFTPDWIGKKIFNVPKVERLLSMAPVSPIIYRTDDIILSAAEEKLIISLRKLNEVCMTDAESKALTILKLLPHTPISAIGVNFGFVEESPLPSLLELCNYANNAEVAAATESDISKSELKRTLTNPESPESILNFSLSFDGSAVEFNGNYHHSVDLAKTAADKIKGRTVPMLQSFLKLLSTIYKLSTAEEANNG